MRTFRQLVFNKYQNSFMRFMLKLPFIHDLQAGGWLLDPLSDKVLAGVCDYEAPKIAGAFISFIIDTVLENRDSRHNQRLCLKYGLITRVDE